MHGRTDCEVAETAVGSMKLDNSVGEREADMVGVPEAVIACVDKQGLDLGQEPGGGDGLPSITVAPDRQALGISKEIPKNQVQFRRRVLAE